MTKITYRPIQKQDYDAIIKLICQAFGFHKYIDDPRILDHCLTIYLNTCLAETSFSSIAVQNGTVIGLILGHSKKDRPLVSPTKCYTIALYHAIALTLCSKKGRTLLSQFKKTGTVYKELSHSTALSFGGSVTLFIVSPQSQGLGVGKTLFTHLLAYMKSQEIKDFYLYTDTNCNYGFYDYNGFKRLASQTTSFFHHQVSLDMFLYGYHL